MACTGSTALELVSTGMSVLTGRFNDRLQLELGILAGLSEMNLDIGDTPVERRRIDNVYNQITVRHT